MTRPEKTHKSIPSNDNCSSTKGGIISGKGKKRDEDNHVAEENLEDLCRDFSHLGFLEDDRHKRVLWSVTYEQNSKSTQTNNAYENFFDNKSTQTGQELSPDFCYQDDKDPGNYTADPVKEVLGRERERKLAGRNKES